MNIARWWLARCVPRGNTNASMIPLYEGDSAMLATILIHVPLVLVPLLPLAEPTRDCQLEVSRHSAIEESALREFEASVETYVDLHRRLARWMSPAQLFDEGGVLGDELRDVIVAARPEARQGDFFTPPVAEVFRARIDIALLHGVAGVAAQLYAPLPGEVAPAVNQPFPMVFGTVQWPTLVSKLPMLPRELGYAFWGRDLVLVDLPANLVVDVLPEAVPEGARPGVIYQ
jgi:hypothetical protein